MRVVSVNVGAAQPQPQDSGKLTGIYKLPAESIRVDTLGVAGDVVCNTKHHGGPSKAVCVFCADHFPWFQQRYPDRDWSPGAFGENLSVTGWDEGNCRVGDLLRIGEVTVQVSQPRGPCATLAGKHRIRDFISVCLDAGLTGWYLRVLVPGTIRAGDAVEVVTEHPAGMTIARANATNYADPPDPGSVTELLAVEALSDAWRSSLGEKLRRNGAG